MHLAGFTFLLLCLLLCLCMAGAACLRLWRGRTADPWWFERGHLVQTVLLSLAALLLFRAFAVHDFSFQYVAGYSDRLMPLFYSLTAFWAGQEGSLLFWIWAIALFGLAYTQGRSYQSLLPATRTWFWLFFLTMQAFLLLLATSWSNPFLVLPGMPADGNGLNPLLRNPAMIFHPPLLFLGYAGFTIPGCLALAQAMAGPNANEPSWVEGTRNTLLAAWLFLTAGILLGAWWSYMELGWGGYWAWDPVENASLLPWLTGTALLHTALVERRRNALHRTNVALASTTVLACFFATYLVRSGIVDSLHAFGGSGVGLPLLLFLLFGFGLTALILPGVASTSAAPIGGPTSREGLLILAVWLLLMLALIVGVATLWPVITLIWGPQPRGLDAGFYNRACLPLFALLMLLMAACPWMSWKHGVKDRTALTVVGIIFLVCLAGLFLAGIRKPLALLGLGGATSSLATAALLFFRRGSLKRLRPAGSALGVHLGVALVTLGVAASGSYETSAEALLMPGQSLSVAGYDIVYQDIQESQSPAMALQEARLAVSRQGKAIGELRPQRQFFNKFNQPFAEASILPGLGDELYATLLSVTEQGQAGVKVSVHPLVNWIWIGGSLMCLFPLVQFLRRRQQKPPFRL